LAEAPATNNTLRLAVTLRPDEDAERITLDLAAATITFLRAEKVYTCSLCDQFSAASTQAIARWHSKTAHDDRLAFRAEKGLTRQLTMVVYAGERPLAGKRPGRRK